jgi:hypothetical protein
LREAATLDEAEHDHERHLDHRLRDDHGKDPAREDRRKSAGETRASATDRLSGSRLQHRPDAPALARRRLAQVVGATTSSANENTRQMERLVVTLHHVDAEVRWPPPPPAEIAATTLG